MRPDVFEESQGPRNEVTVGGVRARHDASRDGGTAMPLSEISQALFIQRQHAVGCPCKGNLLRCSADSARRVA